MAEVVMDVHLPNVDPGHSASQAALAEFLEDLGTVPPLRPTQRDLPAEGAFKGPLTELVVSVSTSGGVAALVKIMRIWLGRDRKRSLKVTVRTAENATMYEISGDDVSVETLRDALEAAVRTQTPSDSGSA